MTRRESRERDSHEVESWEGVEPRQVLGHGAVVPAVAASDFQRQPLREPGLQLTADRFLVHRPRRIALQTNKKHIIILS